MPADDPELERQLEADAVAFCFAREKRFRVGKLRRRQAVDERDRGGRRVSGDGVDVHPQRRVPIRRAPRRQQLHARRDDERVQQHGDA